MPRPACKPNGHGTVRQLPSKRWIVRISVTGPNGKQRQVSLTPGRTFATKKEAEKALEAYRVDRERGLIAPHAATNLEAWVRQWFALKWAELKPKSVANYREAMERHVLPHLGHKTLQALKASDGQAWLVKLAASCSASTVKQARSVLSQALDLAVLDDLVAKNVLKGLKRLRTTASEAGRALRPQEARAFCSVSRGHRLWGLFELAMITGLRRGEITALRWSHVDVDAAVLRVRENVVVVDGQPVVNLPKTRASVRDVPLAPPTVAFLRAWKAAQEAERAAALVTGRRWEDTDHVFTTTVGTRLHPDMVSRLARDFADVAGLGRVRFHDLRVTAISWWAANGVPLEVAKEWAGHANLSVTADVYRKVLPHEHARYVLSFEDVLRDTPAILSLPGEEGKRRSA